MALAATSGNPANPDLTEYRKFQDRPYDTVWSHYIVVNSICHYIQSGKSDKYPGLHSENKPYLSLMAVYFDSIIMCYIDRVETDRIV